MSKIIKQLTREEFNTKNCQAYNRKGYQCGNSPIEDKKVCRLHGGETPIGPKHHNWKDGRYSKYLPKNLLEMYETGLTDPDLLSLKHELAMTDARIMQKMEQVGVGGSAQDWLALQGKWSLLVEAQNAGEKEKANSLLVEVNGLITAGADAARSWKEIDPLVETRRRIAQTEGKRMADMQLMISSERVMALFFALVGSVKNHLAEYKEKGKIVDDGLLSSIAEDTRKLITRTNS